MAMPECQQIIVSFPFKQVEEIDNIMWLDIHWTYLASYRRHNSHR